MIVTNTVNYPVDGTSSQINVGLATSTENGQPVNSVLSGITNFSRDYRCVTNTLSFEVTEDEGDTANCVPPGYGRKKKILENQGNNTNRITKAQRQSYIKRGLWSYNTRYASYENPNSRSLVRIDKDGKIMNKKNEQGVVPNIDTSLPHIALVTITTSPKGEVVDNPLTGGTNNKGYGSGFGFGVGAGPVILKVLKER